ncbi:unnamed protein product [Amoebophrya sp. A25]|nr:unnamed protein product [Amoebophrya sp. A25]|eukprot:GSA25T00001495001.1
MTVVNLLSFCNMTMTGTNRWLFVTMNDVRSVAEAVDAILFCVLIRNYNFWKFKGFI